MDKHIKLFNTTAEFEIFRDSDDYVEPHVSLCKDTSKVNYNRAWELIAALYNNVYDYGDVGGDILGIVLDYGPNVLIKETNSGYIEKYFILPITKVYNGQTYNLLSYGSIYSLKAKYYCDGFSAVSFDKWIIQYGYLKLIDVQTATVYDASFDYNTGEIDFIEPIDNPQIVVEALHFNYDSQLISIKDYTVEKEEEKRIFNIDKPYTHISTTQIGSGNTPPINYIKIPNCVTTIKNDAFGRDAYFYLKEIEIPKSVTYIGENSILAYGLIIHYEGTKQEWETLLENSCELTGLYRYELICSDGEYSYGNEG